MLRLLSDYYSGKSAARGTAEGKYNARLPIVDDYCEPPPAVFGPASHVATLFHSK